MRPYLIVMCAWLNVVPLSCSRTFSLVIQVWAREDEATAVQSSVRVSRVSLLLWWICLGVAMETVPARLVRPWSGSRGEISRGDVGVSSLQTAVKLVLGWIFDGHSVQFQPRLHGGLPGNSSRRTGAPRRASRWIAVHELLHVNISIQNTWQFFQ